jgi:hypothetical protein
MKPSFFRTTSFSKKTWRRVARVTVAILSLYLIFLAGLSIYISSSRERLVKFLTERIKETILGEFKIDKADITVWQSFPKLGITLTNVSISDSFYHRPFLKAKEITAKAGFLDLMGTKVKISSVKIEDAVIHTFTDTSGYTNSYVLKPQNKPVRESKKPVVISNLELKNVIAISENEIKKKRYEIRFTHADVDMAMHGSKYSIKVDEDALIRGLGFNLPKGYWLENQRIQAVWKFEFDTVGNKLSFNDTRIKIQGHPFNVKGTFYLNAPTHFHVEASTRNISYNAALAILKPTTRQKINKIQLSKGLDAKLVIDGPTAYRSIPLVQVDFNTTDNDLTTPVVGFTNCTFNGKYLNNVDTALRKTDENSRVIIYSFQSKWGDIDLKAKNIAITNLIHPNIQFEFYSECTLPQLDDQLASETLRFITGNAKLYLSYNGPLIASAALLNQLNAKIRINNGKIVYVPRSLTFSECNGDVVITGNNLLINNFQCNLNTNHFVVNVNGVNLNRISSKEAGKASITCNVFSPAVNLSDFRALFAKKANAAVKRRGRGLAGTAASIDNAVERGNLYLNLKAQKLSLDNFQANNVTANLLFEENDWEIKQASLQHADGSFNLSAKVHQLSEQLHQANIQMNLQHINVKKLFYAFNNFGQTGITANNLRGIMDSRATIAAGINNTGKLIPNTINGKMFFSLKNGSLINIESFQHIQKYVLKNRDLRNVEFAELKDTFNIKNGDIYIQRMPIQSSALTMYIEGVYSFENRTDISIQVPLTTLVNKPGDFKKIDDARTQRPGPSIYLRAKDDKNGQVKIGLDMFKKVRKNKSDQNAE